MPSEHPNAILVREFHERQNRFYAGGDQGPSRALLAEDVVWHVPGRSVIAGDYRGREEVLRHFAARRELSRASFRITVRGVLADDEHAVIFAAGEARRGGETSRWTVAGVFRIADGKIAECWVLPYDQYRFDEIWA